MGTAGGSCCSRSGCGVAEWCSVSCNPVGKLIYLPVPGCGPAKGWFCFRSACGRVQDDLSCASVCCETAEGLSCLRSDCETAKATSCTRSDCGTSSRSSAIASSALDWFFSVVISKFHSTNRDLLTSHIRQMSPPVRELIFIGCLGSLKIFSAIHLPNLKKVPHLI